MQSYKEYQRLSCRVASTRILVHESDLEPAQVGWMNPFSFPLLSYFASITNGQYRTPGTPRGRRAY